MPIALRVVAAGILATATMVSVALAQSSTGRIGNPTQGIDPTIGAQSLDRGATGRPGNPTQGIDPTVGARSLDRGATGRAGNPAQGIDPTLGTHALQPLRIKPRPPATTSARLPYQPQPYSGVVSGTLPRGTDPKPSTPKAGNLPTDLQRCQANWDPVTTMSRASWNEACRRMLAAGRLGR